MSTATDLSEDEIRCEADETASTRDRVFDILEVACPPGACLRSFVDELTAEILASRRDSFITISFDPAAGTPQQASIILHEERFWLALAAAAEKRMV